MADRTVLVPDDVLGMRAVRCLRIERNIKDIRVALDAKLPYAAAFEHLRILRTVRRMACGAAFQLERGVFEHERALLIGVALHAGLIGADSKSCLLLFEAAVGIMAIAAAHGPFEHFVAEGFRELRFHLAVARKTELRFVVLEHCPGCKVRPLSGNSTYEGDRARLVIRVVRAVGGVAVGTADVVSPVVAAAEVVVGLFAGVTGHAGL